VLSSNPLNRASLGLIQSWLTECNSGHKSCSSTTVVATLPSRLIALTSLPGRNALTSVPDQVEAWRSIFKDGECKLIENESHKMGHYVSLSYCWGQGLSYTTTRANLSLHRQRIMFDKLPRTLQDAIMIARFLEYDYIWIDCLCIVQDDARDWAQEAARMADVYSNATLSIAANRATNCDEGFLHDRAREPWCHVPFEDSEGAFDLYFRPSRGSSELDTQEEWRLDVSWYKMKKALICRGRC
jgi:hypothetical protein